jgi:hypothetical protein
MQCRVLPFLKLITFLFLSLHFTAPSGEAAAAKGQGAAKTLGMVGSSCGFDRVRTQRPEALVRRRLNDFRPVSQGNSGSK